MVSTARHTATQTARAVDTEPVASCQSITVHMFQVIVNAQEAGPERLAMCRMCRTDRVARTVVATPTAAANTTTKEGTIIVITIVEVCLPCQ